MSNSLNVTVKDRAIRSLLEKQFPKFTNQAMNRAYRSVASKFMRGFAKEKLGAGGPFNVRRKVQVKKAPKGQPSIGAKARKAGFKAVLSGQQHLDRKSLSVRTRNPLLTIREFGGEIRPKKGTRVRGKKRRIPYLAVKIKRRGRGAKEKGPNIFLVRQIRFGAVLGFRKAWRRFQPKLREIVNEQLRGVIRRINKKTQKARRGGSSRRAA